MSDNPLPSSDDVLDYYSLTSEQQGRDVLEDVIAKFPQYEKDLRAFAAFRQSGPPAIEPDGEPCVEHQWTGAQSGAPGEPVDWIQYCAVCGAEYQGSYDEEAL